VTPVAPASSRRVCDAFQGSGPRASWSRRPTSSGSGPRRKVASPPPIFRVNWFRKDENGKFMGPGYGQNMRVLKWIVDRVNGRAPAVESPLGFVPPFDAIEWKGLSYPRDKFQELMPL
jgi:GTP-dependent phosphoenolpyruvate carboxykinase